MKDDTVFAKGETFITDMHSENKVVTPMEILNIFKGILERISLSPLHK